MLQPACRPTSGFRTSRRDLLYSPVLVIGVTAMFVASVILSAAVRADSQKIGSHEVLQARVAPQVRKLPVVDRKGIRFTRFSTAEGLSQTKVAQIVQDDQGGSCGSAASMG
jgi:hypothetical protein